MEKVSSKQLNDMDMKYLVTIKLNSDLLVCEFVLSDPSDVEDIEALITFHFEERVDPYDVCLFKKEKFFQESNDETVEILKIIYDTD